MLTAWTLKLQIMLSPFWLFWSPQVYFSRLSTFNTRRVHKSDLVLKLDFEQDSGLLSWILTFKFVTHIVFQSNLIDCQLAFHDKGLLNAAGHLYCLLYGSGDCCYCLCFHKVQASLLSWLSLLQSSCQVSPTFHPGTWSLPKQNLPQLKTHPPPCYIALMRSCTFCS